MHKHLSLQKVNVYKNLVLILTWLTIMSAGPFVFLMLPFHPHKYFIAFNLIIAIMLIIFKGRIAHYNKNLVAILSLQSIFCCFAFYFHGYQEYLNLLLQFIAIGVIYILITTFIGNSYFAKSITTVVSIMGIMGVIAFILVLFDLLDPISTFSNPDGRMNYNYFLTFSNSLKISGETTIIRVAGFFDEPGTFGWIIMATILLNKAYMNNKRYEALLLLVGMFTFSVLYYISVFVYLFVFYFNTKIIAVGFKYFVIIVLFLTYIHTNPFNSDAVRVIDRITVRRILSLEGGEKILSDNIRFTYMKNAYFAFIDKPFMGLGMSYREDQKNAYYGEYMSSNILGPFARDGIVGLSFLYLHVIYLVLFALKNIKTNPKLFKIALVIIFLFLDRPMALGLFNYLIFMMLIESKNTSKLNKQGKTVLLGA